MISIMPKKIIVFMAHPDDEVLSCFGTLARFASEGSEIVISFLTDGHLGRLSTSIETSKLINDRIQVPDKSSLQNELLETRKAVEYIDECIAVEKPSLVITHAPAISEHHEHRNLSSMVLNSVIRSVLSPWLWFTEPLPRNNGFCPNLFVDITQFMRLKLEAC